MDSYPWYVTADIHNEAEVLEELVERATRDRAGRFLIAGDLCPKSPAISIALAGAPFAFVAVRGNSDWIWDFKDANLPIPRETSYLALPDGHHVGMTHGHMIAEASDFPTPLESGDIFILGHSHVPSLARDERTGIITLNPGSPSRPRSTFGASYAVIETGEIRVVSLKGGKVLMRLALT